jgi:membrane fusion protein (multidrug efflux system)
MGEAKNMKNMKNMKDMKDMKDMLDKNIAADLHAPQGPTQNGVEAGPVRATNRVDAGQKLLHIFVLAAFGLVCAAGYQYSLDWLRFVTTDDASIEGRHTFLAPKVFGIVTEVLFDDNEAVKKDQALVQIDPRDFQNALMASRSELKAIQARAKDASIKSQEADNLFKAGAINAQQRDTAEALRLALHAEAERVQAHIEQNLVDLHYATIRAPSDGRVGRRTVEPGMYANAGQALVSFVTARQRWVVANFKETQLANMHIGSRADITVDALPNRTFAGVVESVSPSSGAIFSLTPPDNATGNYIKIVQRVPVRIKLEGLTDADLELLQVGLNANVRIAIH